MVTLFPPRPPGMPAFMPPGEIARLARAKAMARRGRVSQARSRSPEPPIGRPKAKANAEPRAASTAPGPRRTGMKSRSPRAAASAAKSVTAATTTTGSLRTARPRSKVFPFGFLDAAQLIADPQGPAVWAELKARAEERMQRQARLSGKARPTPAQPSAHPSSSAPGTTPKAAVASCSAVPKATAVGDEATCKREPSPSLPRGARRMVIPQLVEKRTGSKATPAAKRPAEEGTPRRARPGGKARPAQAQPIAHVPDSALGTTSKAPAAKRSATPSRTALRGNRLQTETSPTIPRTGRRRHTAAKRQKKE